MAGPFQTPANERSFSSLIDDAIVATGRPGSLIQAVQAANLTIRECQTLGLFARDLIEDQLLVDVTPFVWTRPSYFRSLRTAKYVNSCEFPKFRLPGRQQKDQCSYYYSADDYFVFAGAAIGETINTATYYWRKPLIYFALLGSNTAQFPGGPYAIRPAYFDVLLDKWQYLNTAGTAYVDTTGSSDGDIAAQNNASNWLTIEWRDLILSGTCAKIWTSFGDARGPVKFSEYKQTQKLLQATVGVESEGF